MRDPALLALLGLIFVVATANIVLVLSGLIPFYLGAVSVIAGIVAIGLALLQARG